MSRVDNIIGARLRTRRKLVAMTQHELAQACGITFQQVQKYECAATRLSVAMLWKLSQVLGVEIDYFFCGLPYDLGPEEGRRRRVAPAR